MTHPRKDLHVGDAGSFCMWRTQEGRKVSLLHKLHRNICRSCGTYSWQLADSRLLLLLRNLTHPAGTLRRDAVLTCLSTPTLMLLKLRAIIARPSRWSTLLSQKYRLST